MTYLEPDSIVHHNRHTDYIWSRLIISTWVGLLPVPSQIAIKVQRKREYLDPENQVLVATTWTAGINRVHYEFGIRLKVGKGAGKLLSRLL